VPDLDNPKACPYRLEKGGEKVKGAGKSSITLTGRDQGHPVPDEGPEPLGAHEEYARRDSEIDDLKKERDALKRGTSSGGSSRPP
jgi:hypothetical protein